MANPNTLTLEPQDEILQDVVIRDHMPADWVEATPQAQEEISPALQRSLGRVANQATLPVGKAGNANGAFAAFNSAVQA